MRMGPSKNTPDVATFLPIPLPDASEVSISDECMGHFRFCLSLSEGCTGVNEKIYSQDFGKQ